LDSAALIAVCRAILEFDLRKPLGRLAAALLAGVAIPLAIAPSAFATGPALTVDQPNDPASTVGKEFKDNTASGVDLANGTGILRIASAAGVPTNITSKFFDVIDGPYQAEEDGRFWDVTVKLHKGHDFKKGGVDVSWHCGGHSPKPPKESKKPTSAPATTSTPATSDAPPTSETPIATVTPTEPPSVLPTSESPATETSSVETSTVESATSESPTSE
jgi:hypothetical protein